MDAYRYPHGERTRLIGQRDHSPTLEIFRQGRLEELRRRHGNAMWYAKVARGNGWKPAAAYWLRVAADLRRNFAAV